MAHLHALYHADGVARCHGRIPKFPEDPIFDKQEQPVDYKFLEVNPSFEKQSGLHDAAGKRMREFAPDMEASWFTRYGDVALTGEPVRFIVELKTFDSWFDVYAFRIGGPESRKVAVICNNIIQRTKVEQALRESAEALADLDHRKDEFLAMLGHELRNPLAPLSNAVHILRLQTKEEPLQRQARQIIERQVSQLKHLVDDLLEISRVSTGRLQLRQERIEVSGVVERAVETDPAAYNATPTRTHGVTAAATHLVTRGCGPDGAGGGESAHQGCQVHRRRWSYLFDRATRRR